MNLYINTLANDITTEFLQFRIDDENELIKKVRSELYEIKSEQDKLGLLTIVLEANEIKYQKHLKDECTELKDCPTNKSHERVAYFLQQELREIGFQGNDDSFTSLEKERCNEKLDEILQTILNTNEIISENIDILRNEIEELKSLFVLGKKNWKQQFAGKMTDMVTSGIVSELTAKPFIEKILNPSIEFISTIFLD